MDENGEDINSNTNLPGAFTEEECLTECKNKRADVGSQMTACEWKANRECIYHTLPVKKANNNPNYTCCIFDGRKMYFS